MSKCQSNIINCPKCSKESNFTIWESINATLDPDLKEQLLDESLLTFTCSFCFYQTKVFYTLLYHDMDKSFMVWWIPDQQQLEKYLASIKLGPNPPFSQGYRMRFVPTFYRLREKILIFDHGLDDRALELLKHYLWSVRLQEQGIDQSWLYVSSIIPREDYPDIEITIFSPQTALRTLSVSGKMGYPRSRELLHKDFQVPIQEKPEWKVIDHNYWDLVKNGRD